MSGERVLVTGGSGFLGAHCILQLLDAGYRVRTTVRSLKREADVRAMLKIGGADTGEELSFVVTDLMKDTGWPEALAGCDYVLHIASPFPPNQPKNEDELIIPAREGTLRVLRAARDAGVKRVVLTSSIAAVSHGSQPANHLFTEEDWTDLNIGHLRPYIKSKTLAERAAWDFIAREGGALGLAVVNPGGICGPVLGADYSTSIQVVQRLMDGAAPGCPRLFFSIVDVRDVVDLHLRAMTNPIANGQRFLAVAGDSMTIQQIALILKRRLGDAARRVPTRKLPDWLVRLVSLADPSIAQFVPELGKPLNAANAKARNMLGWSPRSSEEAIVATAESLLQLGLLRNGKKG
jgi:nucleoside-diphosphate-sugar epimerase